MHSLETRLDRIERSLNTQLKPHMANESVYSVSLLYQDPQGHLKKCKVGNLTVVVTLPEIMAHAVQFLSRHPGSTLIRAEYSPPTGSDIEIYIET